MGRINFFQEFTVKKVVAIIAVMAAWTFIFGGSAQKAMADDCLDAVQELDELAVKFAKQAKNIDKVVDQKLDIDEFYKLAEYAEKAAGNKKISNQERDMIWSMARKAQFTNARKAVEAEVEKLKEQSKNRWRIC